MNADDAAEAPTIVFDCGRCWLCCSVAARRRMRQAKARDLLNKGVPPSETASTTPASRISSRPRISIPTLLNARLYLATAYATEYIPGAPSR